MLCVLPILYLIAAGAEQDWIDYASRLGVIGILLIANYGFYKGWWVYNLTHMDLQRRYEIRGQKIERLEQERDAWKEQALTGTKLAERTTSIAEAAMRRGQQVGGS